MDAWLKGIRTIKVIYDNYAPPAAAQELMAAAEIMEMTVRIGIRFHRNFRGQRVTLVWTPRGFSGPIGFNEFLALPPMQALIAEGKLVDARQNARFAQLVETYNRDYRVRLNERFDLSVAELELPEFEALVSNGQPSWAHLADCIHRRTVAAMRTRWDEVSRRRGEASEQEQARQRERLAAMEQFSPVTVLDDWLRAAIAGTEASIDTLVEEDPPALLRRLAAIGTDYRASIDSRDLSPSQVLQLLHLCEGRVTHLELFKLRTYRPEQLPQLAAMNELREAVNSTNPVRFKRLVTGFIDQTPPDAVQDLACLQDLLHSMPSMLARYGARPLSTFLGSDSSGRTDWGGQHGMGFVIIETLPAKEQRACRGHHDRQILPLRYGLLQTVERNIDSAIERSAHVSRFPVMSWVVYWWFRLVGLLEPGKREWIAPLESLKVTPYGNVLPLGGIGAFAGNQLGANAAAAGERQSLRWDHVNTVLVNIGFILAGFIPAFLTFRLTQTGFLALWGAPLWFAVTGIRNILQAVIAGGGLRRYSNLTWKDYVSWTRLSESLFYTGFSVPLLELGVRYLMLEKGFGLTAANAPALVFLVIAIRQRLLHHEPQSVSRTADRGGLCQSGPQPFRRSDRDSLQFGVVVDAAVLRCRQCRHHHRGNDDASVEDGVRHGGCDHRGLLRPPDDAAAEVAGFPRRPAAAARLPGGARIVVSA